MTNEIHGCTKTGQPIDDAMIDALVEEAERGYDLDALFSRRGGGAPPGLCPPMDEDGFNPVFRKLLVELREERGATTAEVFDEAVRRFAGLDDGAAGANGADGAVG